MAECSSAATSKALEAAGQDVPRLRHPSASSSPDGCSRACNAAAAVPEGQAEGGRLDQTGKQGCWCLQCWPYVCTNILKHARVLRWSPWAKKSTTLAYAERRSASDRQATVLSPSCATQTGCLQAAGRQLERVRQLQTSHDSVSRENAQYAVHTLSCNLDLSGCSTALTFKYVQCS